MVYYVKDDNDVLVRSTKTGMEALGQDGWRPYYVTDGFWESVTRVSPEKAVKVAASLGFTLVK